MAAKRPIAVASNASAMPGATTARLVVCAFEMPMKLFMIPHTVPKQADEGAGGTDRREKPRAAFDREPLGALNLGEAGGDPLLEAGAAEYVRR